MKHLTIIVIEIYLQILFKEPLLCSSEVPFTVFGPKEISSDTIYPLGVCVFEKPKSPLQVEVSIHYNNISIQSKKMEFKKRGFKVVIFQPIKRMKGTYQVKTKATADKYEFQEEADITFLNDTVFIFVQTDKAVYKPGNKVLFRILIVNNTLIPVKRVMNLFIRDSKGNPVKQYKRIHVDQGVFEGEIDLSDEPNLGMWNINVVTLEENTDGGLMKKTFEVQEYVPPYFEVLVDAPKYFTVETKSLAIKVTAKYMSGENVKGVLNVTINPKSELKKVFTRNIDGEAIVELEMCQPATMEFKAREADGELVCIYHDDEVTYTTMDAIEIVAQVIDLVSEIVIESKVEKIIRENVEYKVHVSGDGNLKPGLLYTGQVTVKFKDGSPFGNNKTLINITCSKRTIMIFNATGNIVDGKFKFEANISDVRFPDITTVDCVIKFNEFTFIVNDVMSFSEISPSNSYLKVYITSPTPILVGDVILYRFMSNQNMKSLVCLFIGSGKIVSMQNIALKKKRKVINFKVAASHEMAIKAKVIVYYIQNEEFVGDVLEYKVNGFTKTPLKIEANPTSIEAGKSTDLVVTTSANTLNFLLGVDRTSYSLENMNDITEAFVLEELSKRTRTADTFSGSESRMLKETFRESNLIYISNSIKKKTLKTSSVESVGAVYYNAITDTGGLNSLENYKNISASASFAWDSSQSPSTDEHPKHAKAAEAAAVQPVDLPKKMSLQGTWLWTNKISDSNGRSLYSVALPDNIVSEWLITGFAMNSLTGLGLTKEPTLIRTHRDLMIKSKLPFSIQRGETLVLPVSVFNSRNIVIKAEITLLNNKEEFWFYDEKTKKSMKTKLESKVIEIPANNSVVIHFSIVPKVVGEVDVHITGHSDGYKDSNIEKLKVKPEGVTQEFNEANLITLASNIKPVNYMVQIKVPKTVVADSEKIRVSVGGDILTPLLNSLDHLLKLPINCGEQTMISFVPYLVILDSLTKTKRISEVNKTKAIKSMRITYQSMLKYRRDDGSFAVWGSKETIGSIFLTAYYVKSLLQAREYIHLDDKIIKKAIDYLVKQQQPDGQFMTSNWSISEDFDNNPIGLTAYVVIAIFNAKNARPRYANAILKGESYLVNHFQSLNSPYTLALVCFAFHLTQNSQKEQAFKKLMSFKRSDGHLIWWSEEKQPKPHEHRYSYVYPGKDIEMSSYALMILLSRNDTQNAFRVAKWLITQQNSNGGFSSTQDTVIAIQALSLFSKAQSKIDMDIIFEFDGHKKTIKITDDNYLLLQKHDLPPTTRSVKIVGSGIGVGVVQVSWEFNLADKELDPVFKVITDVKIKNKVLHIQLDFNHTMTTSSGMVIIETTLPSGYKFDRESVTFQSTVSIQKIEFADKNTKIIIYLSRILKEVVVSFEGIKHFDVYDLKQASIIIYEYYNQIRTQLFYEIHSDELMCKT